MRRRTTLNVTLALTLLAALINSSATTHSQIADDATARIVGEIMARGQQLRYLSMLADEIGSRLTGTANARRAEEATEAEMRRIGLSNVRREPYTMRASWERGTASASLVSPNGERRLTVASYTWTPGTNGAVEGDVVVVGEGRTADIDQARARLKGAVALVTFEGATLDALIDSFYRTPQIVRDLKAAGAVAALITADKQNTLLYTAPIEFNGNVAALASVSVAREDSLLLRRLVAEGRRARVRLDVRNKLGPAFEATNVVGEIAGRDLASEIVVVGAHLDSNDLGPGALDNGAGSAAVLETARALKSLGLRPRRTIRFVLFTGEEEGMLGSTAYVKRHRDEMDRTVAALVMDIGAGRPLGWFSMGRPDLDAQINALMQPLAQFGASAIDHSAFAATDNAAFMAEGVPNLVMIQDDAPYLPVHHTAADTFDKADPRDFASCVAVLAASAYAIADAPARFGRRLTPDEVKKMAADTKVDAQWRAAGIW
ncbi:MAG: M20/M25/M40 family metallo-hydrolase [Acidobacteriota bacterium]|nr:M20/M25/M40 family metallo-hydrolase [Acidobacteriota bacterium]